MKTLIANGKLNVKDNTCISCDVLIEDGVISAKGQLQDKVAYDQLIDAKGCLISPGLVDVHVHLREPGQTHKETIASGTQAAAKGGFTTICAMPNTLPVLDNPEVLEQLQATINKDASVRVLPYGTITRNLRTEDLTDFAALHQAGAFALTNDGVGVQTAGVMYQAMKKAKELNLSIVAHTEDDSLLYGGVMHEGNVNHTLGLPGMLDLSESVQIARDSLLAQATGVHYHVCHVSSKESVRIIRDAKAAGINITAEVTPHHLLLCEEDIIADDAAFKMNPPLRSRQDKLALIAGLEDGTLDCIATDHAPHAADEKSHGFKKSLFGIIGLEHAFALCYSEFVKPGHWTLQQLLDWLTCKPAEVFNLPYGTLEIGAPADITVIDLEKTETIMKDSIVSKSHNTPFINKKVTSKVLYTLVGGKLVYDAGAQ